MDGIGATVWKKIFRGMQKMSAQLEMNKAASQTVNKYERESDN
jgi:hypothetical protein